MTEDERMERLLDEVEWPAPRPDPEREPSHPEARRDPEAQRLRDEEQARGE